MGVSIGEEIYLYIESKRSLSSQNIKNRPNEMEINALKKSHWKKVYFHFISKKLVFLILKAKKCSYRCTNM